MRVNPPVALKICARPIAQSAKMPAIMAQSMW